MKKVWQYIIELPFISARYHVCHIEAIPLLASTHLPVGLAVGVTLVTLVTVEPRAPKKEQEGNTHQTANSNTTTPVEVEVQHHGFLLTTLPTDITHRGDDN